MHLATHARRMRALCAATVTASAAAGLAHQWPASALAPPPVPTAPPGVPSRPPGPLGPADGAVPAGTTPFDDSVPAVAALDPALLAALRGAAVDGLVVNGGWRSAAYQQQLLEAAIAQYGSSRAAARWVARPATSAHASGDAVDVGPPSAAARLAEHGAEHGLCRIYANEPWHFELRPDAVGQGCPPPYPDPTHDPRMQP